MRGWGTLCSAILIVVIFAAVEAGIWWVTIVAHSDVFVPAPDTVAAEFIKALAAHRYASAAQQLSPDLRRRMPPEALRTMALAAERSGRGIEDVLDETAQEHGDEATATVQVMVQGGSKVRVTLPLHRENGLWRITSVEPLFQSQQP